MKSFKPGDLMQGYSIDEQTAGSAAVLQTLDIFYGNDKDMHVCILSFLLGYSLVESKITPKMAIGMTLNAKLKAEEEGIGQ